MANQRKKGIERITLTIPEEMLARFEEQAEEQGTDRLALMREALRSYLGPPGSTLTPLRETGPAHRSPPAAVAPVAAAAKAKAKAAAKGNAQAKKATARPGRPRKAS